MTKENCERLLKHFKDTGQSEKMKEMEEHLKKREGWMESRFGKPKAKVILPIKPKEMFKPIKKK